MKSVILICASVLTRLVTLTLSGCGGASGVSITPPPPPQALAITSSAPPNGSVQTAYGGSGFPLVASGGVQPYAWSWAPASGSTLPPGLGLSASGLISGTPTTAGSYNVSVTVTDSETQSANASASYSIIIAASRQLVITSGAPPNGTVNQTYGGSFSITENHCLATFTGWQPSAAGGTGNLSWSWSAAPGSSLPPSLSIGVESYTCGGSTRCCVTVSSPPLIHGTPTTGGTYHVIVTVTDSASPPAQASANYTIAINGATVAAAAKTTAEAPSAPQFPHYKLIDLGTLGGPNSSPAVPAFESLALHSLNNKGTFVGQAETSSAPDPNCLNPDCLAAHAFQWQNGVTTDLGTLSSGQSSIASWISADGLIAGISENGEMDPLVGFPEAHAVLWKQGNIIDLGSLPPSQGGGFTSGANAANDQSQVVGFALNATTDTNSMTGAGYQTRAFLWQNSVMQDLGTLCNTVGTCGTDANAISINERGQIIGQSYTADSAAPTTPFGCGFPLTHHGFLWENGKMLDLGTLGGSCTTPYSLNNSGQIVGQSNLAADLTLHPFLWDRSGTLTDLLGTPSDPHYGNYGYAIGVNEAGEITGTAAEPGDQALVAFLWKNGVRTKLGTVGGDPCSSSDAINSKGQMVGLSGGFFTAGFFPACETTSVEHAFLWDKGQMIDLNIVARDSGLILEEATFINDRGEITGLASLPNGNTHAFLLVPCDEMHPGIEGCDYTPVDASAVGALASPAPVAQRPRSGKTRMRAIWNRDPDLNPREPQT